MYLIEFVQYKSQTFFYFTHNKEAGAFEAPGQTKEELCANDTSRHPKVFKLGAEHGCQ